MNHKNVKVLPHNIIVFSSLNSKPLINLKETPITSHVHDSILTFNQFKMMRRKHTKKKKNQKVINKYVYLLNFMHFSKFLLTSLKFFNEEITFKIKLYLIHTVF